MDAVQHILKEPAPSGLAGFIGGADHIQPRLKVQLGAVQSAKGGAHLLNLQGITSLPYMVHVAG